VSEKKTIGRTELVCFPDFSLEKIQAKIDTGAYTSSIHCTQITEKEGMLEFVLRIKNGKENPKKVFQTNNYKKKLIKSSNGIIQSRYVIKTHITILKKTYLSEFSLANRSKMKNAVLIGRKLLNHRFLVDVALKNQPE
jgi:hypothetical protein